MTEDNNSDFKLKLRNNNFEEKPVKKEEKEEKLTNFLFGGLILFTVVLTALIVHALQGFRGDLMEKNPSYDFPKYSDLHISLLLVVVLVIAKIVIERVTLPISEKIVSQKYNNPEDEANYQIGRVYVKKLSTNMFKLAFYTFMTVWGFSLLSQLDYFPTSLGGKGYLMKMFEPGYPDTFYHWKPANFDIYYLTGLAFCMTDLIWLLFVYELQSDFVLMLLHHICTISLISFSFLTNYSNIGCIVLFLHDAGDIFVYITRIVINTDVRTLFKLSTATFLILFFIYTRLYVFADLILSIYRGITWGFQWPDTSLTLFLCFLYIMHVNWVYLIFKKIVLGIKKDQVEDTCSVKKLSKKKQPYKEDKRTMNRLKGENDGVVNLYEPFEDSKRDLPARGRQLNAKTVVIDKKNVKEIATSSGKATSTSQNVQSGKILIQYQSKRIRADSYAVEEEYESSDSDNSIRNNRKRELLEGLEDTGELPESLRNIYRAEMKSLDNSEDMAENYEVSDDLVYNCEDNLTNEIERILIDIYNNHISFNSKKKKLDISKYEKHIKFFSKTLNKQYNIFILQILSEKIKELINRYKEKIFEIPEIKQIRDRYYEIKASLVSSRKKELEESVEIESTALANTSSEIENPFHSQSHSHTHSHTHHSSSLNLSPAKNKNDKEKEIINKSTCVLCSNSNSVNCLNTSANNSLSTLNSGLVNSNAHGQGPPNNPVLSNSNSNTATSTGTALTTGSNALGSAAGAGSTPTKTSRIEFNEPDKSVTKILLLELRNIKKSLIESSKDIEKNKPVQFSIEDMHREEFTNTLIEDEFISALIAQIKTIARQLKIEEINALISQIEEDLYSSKKEMSRFTAFLIAQLKSFIESDYEDEDASQNERSNSSDTNANQMIQVKNLTLNSHSKNYTSTNSTSNDNSSSPKNKINKIYNDLGIDELVEYIERPVEKKAKKNKKKLKKKKNGKKENSNNALNDQKHLEECDRDVENFRKIIIEGSLNAMRTRKIRPHISREWLLNIVKLVNVQM